MAPGNQYSKNKPFPWRAGANENTTFECNKDLLIEDKTTGRKYGIHMIPSEKEWIIISAIRMLNGELTYDQASDALRVTVIPVKALNGMLMFGFDDLTQTLLQLSLVELLKVLQDQAGNS